MDHSGQTIGKYKLIRRLGQGGMAQVYQAIQPTIDRPVAIKVMHSHLAENDDFLARFKREARGMGLLRHPNIVSILDFDNAGDIYFMVMDFIEGPTLQSYLEKHAPLSAMQSLQITRQLASALAYAHHRGTVHRDIKPGNVMFTDESCKDVVLTDFGIARLMDGANLTMSGTISGTPSYMSPEAAQGARVDDRADIYSLGVILYEMVTGRTPYEGDTPIAVIMKHVTEPLPPPTAINPNIPDDVVRIIERSLAKKPEDRFPSAAAMVSAIDRALASLQGEISNVQGTMSQFDGAVLQPDATQIQPVDRLPSQSGYAQPAPATQVAAAQLATSQQPAGTIHQQPQATIGPAAAPPSTVAQPAGRRRWPLFAAGGILLLCIILTAASAYYYFNLREAPITLEGTVTVAATAAAETELPTEAAEATVPAETPVAVAEATAEPGSTAEAESTVAANPDLPFFEPDRAGTARLASADGVLASQLIVQLDQVPQPPAGTQYQVWLSGNSTVAAGALEVNNGIALGAFNLGENVLASYETVLVTLESEGSTPDTPSGQLIYSGSLAADLRTAVQDLLSSTGPLPNGLAQLELAIQHTSFAQEELAAGNLAGGRQHAEHVINILDGADGEFFGDLDGNGLPENPGDGVGLRAYLEQTRAGLEAIGSEQELTGERQLQLSLALAASDNALTYERQAINDAISILASDTSSEAASNAELLLNSLRSLRLAPPPLPDQPDEETLAGLVQHLLLLLNISLFAEAPLTAAPAGIATSAGGQLGFARFSSNPQSTAGTIAILVDNLISPAPGKRYFAWLETADGSLLPLGELRVQAGLGTLIAATDQPLLTNFVRLLITSQPEQSGADFIGPALYTATLNSPELTLASPLIFAGDAASKGLTLAAEEQLALAVDHAGFINDGLAAGDLALAQRHAEHVVNILAGAESPAFGDLDGNGLPENPGDGVGVAGYLAQIEALAASFAQDESHPQANRTAATTIQGTTAQMQVQVAAAIALAQEILAAPDIAAAQPVVQTLQDTLALVANGHDLDGNGVIDPLLLEGSLADLRELGLAMAQASVVPAE
ncbi:MAG: protein kinase [Ardenticatenales bacterium]|nr:protein kinase [Ardenticatenales bacterium]